MSSGRCLCGKSTLSISGDPQMKALCHCTDCQRITGSTYSTNLIYKEDEVKFGGSPTKSYSKKSEAGRNITSHFCGECGSTLARTGDAFPGAVIVKAGVVDGGLELAKPDAELFVTEKPSWVPELSGANQVKGMPS